MEYIAFGVAPGVAPVYWTLSCLVFKLLPAFHVRQTTSYYELCYTCYIHRGFTPSVSNISKAEAGELHSPGLLNP